MSGEVGQPQSTPQPIVNRPGLAKIAYRIGEFATVRQRLLALLPLVLRQTWGRSPLAKLTTRAEDDPAIALLDAWAIVTDVLTFYQERIANEGFLRTATERRSVLELVRATGYELSPGVAASSYLTFTVEEAPGSPDIVTVPQGTQVMSVPVKDELPQTFETSQSFTAYREWNAIRPRLSRPQTITSTTRQLYLAGTNTQLRAGDFLLLVDEQPTVSTYLLPLTEVLPNSQAGYTLVRWSSSVPAIATTLRNPQVYVFRQRAALFGTNAPAFDIMPAEIKLAAIAQAGGAIRGGVVRSNNNGDRWVAVTQGLPDDDILCLAVRDTTLYVGTPQKGIWRSLDNGDTWEAANEGLTNRNVLALHIAAKDSPFNEAIFAGTPNGGVFRSKDQGANWVPINTGSVRVESRGENNWESINTSLPNTVIRCITTYTNQVRRLTGTLLINGDRVFGTETLFRDELDSESVLIVAGQDKPVAQVVSNTELILKDPFETSNLTDKTTYEATVTVEFDVFNITLPTTPIFTARQTEILAISQGKIISQGNQVQGDGTEFLRLAQFIDDIASRAEVDNVSSVIEIKITIGGKTQTSTIQKENIESDTSLRINTPFKSSSLSSGTLAAARLLTNYIFVGTDEGIYRSIDQGKNWQSQNLKQRTIHALYHLQDSDILAGTDTGVFGSEDDGENWDEGSLLERRVFAIAANSDFVFIGTDQGVFRAARSATPLSWNPIHGDNPNLETLPVRSLETYIRGGRTYLVAATNQGVYLSENSTGESDAVTWRLLNQDLAIRDMSAIAVSDTTKTIFAGSLFKGFAAAEPTQGDSDAIAPSLIQPQSQPPQPLEWPEFRIQDPRQIDLDTLYPQILLDSWLVLFDDRDPQNPAQEALPRIAVRRVNQRVDIQRNAFGLNSKITRIESDEPINPDDFGLRTTTVFARSEVLPLALEPLTVSDRGFDIFQDPIKPSTIFLSKFIQNLQLQQTLIVRGQHSRLSLDHIGGIYRTQFSWRSPTSELEAQSIRVLTVLNTDLVAGTDVGLYRLSSDNASDSLNTGDRWERLYGLKAEPVYALLRLTARDRSSGQATFWAGTEQGLYQTSDINSGWQRISALPEDVVLALAVVKVPERDRSSISAIVSGTTLSATDTTDLNVGDLITLLGTDAQSRFVTAIVGAEQFKINAAFEPEPDTTRTNLASFSIGGAALFVGMRRGLYRSPDHGVTWEAVPALENRTVTALVAWKTSLLAGTETGLWLSQDTGQTWQLIPSLARATVRSLRVDRHGLWIGTTSGLYRMIHLATETPQVNWLKGLRDRSILSITVTHIRSLHSLIVGTDRGIYRSQDDGQTWMAVDAGLNTSEGRSLHVLQCNVWVGTESGVFQAADLGVRVEAPQWEQRDTGLTNSQVTALAIDSSGTVVMAGVTAGVFRSGDGGRTWKPLWDGLTAPGGSLPLPVQALLAQPQSDNPDRWFAATTAGVFAFEPQSQQWQQLKEGLVYTNVRAIALHQNQIYIGTAQGGVLRLEEMRGSATPPRWQPTGLGNTSVQVLVSAENLAFDNNRLANFLVAGTERDGLFISRDQGVLWQQILESRPGRGTLSSTGTQVLWQGAVSGSHLQPGDRINAAGQTRTIVNLTRTTNNQVEMTVDAPFRPDLPDNTGFSINTGLTNRNITAIALARDGTLFVGTAGSGVFRSVDLGDRWQQVITNLDDLEIRCLAVETVGRSQRVWVGTAHQGVFRSDNGGDLWAAVNTHLTNTDIQAILIPPTTGGGLPPVLVGGIGILTSPDGFYTRPVQRGDIVQVLQPPTQLDISTTQVAGGMAEISPVISALVPPLKLWQILVKTPDGLQGVLQTPTLEALTLLPAAPNDELVSEVVTIKEPPTDQQLPRLTLQQPLQYSYDPSTYEILANVVPATHGETVVEVLGSGDGNAANPRFYLKKPPLTYIPAENARGAASTLNVRVDGVLWQEVPSLYPLQPPDQGYIIRIDHEGTPSVTFGDGKRGARLPTGQENIIATYRSGIGLEGNVGPQSLSILKTRPQGISDVTNPLAATGGAGAETLAEARTNAPPTVRTLDRIVSLQDFEDFAQGFAGVGKAEAIALWNGSAPIVHITIAGMKGAAVPETSSLYQKLVLAIAQARDPVQQVVVATYERILFNLEGRLLLDPRYDAEVVSAQVQAALMTAFAFERRSFGQPVTSAEVIEAMQQIAGVTAVDLDALYRFGRSKALEPVLAAESARYDPQTRISYPAQLLLLNPVGVQLTIVSTL